MLISVMEHSLSCSRSSEEAGFVQVESIAGGEVRDSLRQHEGRKYKVKILF